MTRAPVRHLFRRLWPVLLLLGLPVPPCAAREHTDGFDGEDVSWQVAYDKAAARVLSHRRHKRLFQAGVASENMEVEAFAEATTIKLQYPLPPSRLLDELELALWFRSNRDGARLAVRVVFPYQRVPGTEGFLSVLVEGDAYTAVDTWQQLKCTELESRLRQKLPRLRQQILSGTEQRELDLRGLYVDQAVVRIQTGRGTSEYFLDELKLGPLVPAAGDTAIVQASQQEASAPKDIELRLERMLSQGRPFFPRLIPYHGENLDELARLRVNMIWVPDYTDTALLGELRRRGLRSVATPPRLRTESGQPIDDQQASLAPFGPATEPISMWILGTRVPPQAREEVAAWSEQVRNADHAFRRPVTADVTGLERSYSRQLSLLGVSRHPLHTTFSLHKYRDWLTERRNLAQPGAFLWTWVQTEPAPGIAITREAAGLAPAVVEPEQIRLQVYAALAAGYRGIAYWTNNSVDQTPLADRERKLVMAQLNMELELLEPWLATGTLQSQTTIAASLAKTGNFNQLNVDFAGSDRTRARRDALLRERDDYLRRTESLSRELRAASIRTDYGQLLLPVWYGEGAQFVPDQLAVNDARIVIPGATESASVYEVSTTEIRNISPPNKQRVAGGLEITLEKFDLTTAIVLSEDRALIDKLRAKMESLRSASAQVSLDLAQAKLARTSQVDRELHALGVGQVDSARILTSAQLCVEKSRAMFARQQFHESRLLSNNCMQLCRVLQRAYWNDAVRTLYAPVSSPHALGFQTLPDHWRLVQRLGRASGVPTSSLLETGDLEDFDRMVAEGWHHEQAELEGIRATAELHPRAHQGRYSLRVIAVPETGTETPTHVSEPPVTVSSPAIRVARGQVIYIGGWVRLPTAPIAHTDGVLLYESTLGPTGAIRWTSEIPKWQHFELLREIHEDGELKLTLQLAGLGEVFLDDLQIVAYQPAPEFIRPDAEAPLGSRRPQPLDLLKKIPGLGGPPRPADPPRPAEPARGDSTAEAR